MAKNETVLLKIEKIEFPNKGIAFAEDKKIAVKNTLPGQTVTALVKRKKGGYEGRLIEIIERASYEISAACDDFVNCGGCTYQNLDYETELEIKKNIVLHLLNKLNMKNFKFLGIIGAEKTEDYRNKMEFSFGDTGKDSGLSLGMRRRNSYYEVVNAGNCKIVDEDVKKILKTVLDFFKEQNESFYHRIKKTGYLRHLVVRKAYFTGQILINLITYYEHINKAYKLDSFKERLLDLDLDGEIVSILHTVNASQADVVKSDKTYTLYGNEFFYEHLMGLDFKISPFSFFQTNSAGAEILYTQIKTFLGDCGDKIIFDLYCGTGTIAQIIARKAKKVIGVEIVEEAVVAASDNARINGISNCEFMAGDVLKVVSEIEEKPDIIILDPPRDGIHPKAILKIISFNAPKIIYISCKPTSLVRDLEVFSENGYNAEKAVCVDMFPRTYHVETVVLMSRNK